MRIVIPYTLVYIIHYIRIQDLKIEPLARWKLITFAHPHHRNTINYSARSSYKHGEDNQYSSTCLRARNQLDLILN